MMGTLVVRRLMALVLAPLLALGGLGVATCCAHAHDGHGARSHAVPTGGRSETAVAGHGTHDAYGCPLSWAEPPPCESDDDNGRAPERGLDLFANPKAPPARGSEGGKGLSGAPPLVLASWSALPGFSAFHDRGARSGSWSRGPLGREGFTVRRRLAMTSCALLI